jgi:hypothetical protein
MSWAIVIEAMALVTKWGLGRIVRRFVPHKAPATAP